MRKNAATASKHKRKGTSGENAEEKSELRTTLTEPAKRSAPCNDGNSLKPDDQLRIWEPEVPVALLAFCTLRVYAAISTCVADCDETFNYWEPLHYLLYGSGLQTWEYSPEYALRSYAYLVPFAFVGEFLKKFGLQNDKVFVFYGLKAFMGLCCGFCEALMYKGIQERLGRRPAGYFILLHLFSAGMYQAGVAFLPSSTCMILTMLVYAAWMQRNYRLGIYAGLVSVLVPGWPFVAVLYIPFALSAMFDFASQKRFFRMMVWGAGAAISILVPVCLAENGFYKRRTVPLWNIFVYNVLAKDGRGDELYGVEPASYYIKNLFLNLNIAFPLALGIIPMAALSKMASKVMYSEALVRVMFVSPAFIWLALMFSKPHKEERFLYPVYPVLYLSAALVLDMVLVWLSRTINAQTKRSIEFLKWAGYLVGSIIALTGVLSMSRVAAMLRNFSAPCRVFEHFYYKELPEHRQPLLVHSTRTLCVGGEWHRFPSSFFLQNDRVQLGFLPSSFHGQLPQPFQEGNGTWAEPPQPFNDLNKEELSRYVSIKECDFVVEYFPTSPEATVSDLARELNKHMRSWQQKFAHPLLDMEVSEHSIARSFLAPFLKGKLSFGQLVLLQAKAT